MQTYRTLAILPPSYALVAQTLDMVWALLSQKVYVMLLKKLKGNEQRLVVMEGKMLRRTSGVTRVDRTRNEDIRDQYGVAPVVGKLRKSRL